MLVTAETADVVRVFIEASVVSTGRDHASRGRRQSCRDSQREGLFAVARVKLEADAVCLDGIILGADVLTSRTRLIIERLSFRLTKRTRPLCVLRWVGSRDARHRQRADTVDDN